MARGHIKVLTKGKKVAIKAGASKQGKSVISKLPPWFFKIRSIILQMDTERMERDKRRELKVSHDSPRMGRLQ